MPKMILIYAPINFLSSLKFNSQDLLFVLVGLLACTGCIDNIPVELSNEQEYVVIEGKITNNRGPHTVTVKTSGAFSSDDLGFPKPLSAAVRIISDKGEVVELIESEPGIYQVYDYPGEIGTTYFVEVQANEKLFRSSPQKMLPVPKIQSLEYEVQKEEFVNQDNNIVSKNFVNILADFQVPQDNENVFFKWDVKGEFRFFDFSMFSEECFVSDALKLNDYSIFGMESSAGSLVDDFVIRRVETSASFRSDYLFTVYQSSLTKETFLFFKQVQEMINLSGSLFDKPPGLISGNITNQDDPSEIVLGYFYASAVDTLRMFIPGNEIQNLPEKNCLAPPSMPGAPSTNNPNTSGCLCSNMPNSTRIKPSYWPKR